MVLIKLYKATDRLTQTPNGWPIAIAAILIMTVAGPVLVCMAFASALYSRLTAKS